MLKVNLGLFGILIIIFILFFLFYFFNIELKRISEDLDLIKIFLEDIDNDLHEKYKN